MTFSITRWLTPMRAFWLCFALGLCLHVPTLFTIRISQTEGHRALPAIHMVDSGDWLIPQLFGRVYLRKGPVHYWLIAAADATLGRHEGVWRLPSALAGALLYGVVALFAARWFNPRAGLIAGICCASLLVLWGEMRSADIDATNTLFTVTAALCLLELFNREERRGGWTIMIVGGVALGLMVLNKGPAGLTLVGGVLLHAIITALMNRDRRLLTTLRLWAPLAIAGAMVGAYAVAVVIRGPDFSDSTGVQEGLDTLLPHNLSRALEALLTPATLFLYALPVSLALPLLLWRELQGTPRSDWRRLVRATAFSVLLAWALCAASGMVNPRYGYNIAPALAIIAGAVAVRMWDIAGPLRARLSQIAAGCAATFAIATVVLTVISLKMSMQYVVPLSVVCVLSVGMALAVAKQVQFARVVAPRSFAWIIGLIVMLAVAFTAHNWQVRVERSGFAAAMFLQQRLPPGTQLVAGESARYQPDMFYYSQLPTRAYEEWLADPRELPGGVWLVMGDEEIAKWHPLVADRMKHIETFTSHKERQWLAYLDGPPGPLPAHASTPDARTPQSRADREAYLKALNARDWGKLELPE